MIEVAMAVILLSMVFVVIRAIKGPTVCDRILASNTFGTQTILFIALLSTYLGNSSYLDVALIYGLMNFIGTIAFLKYFRYGTFGDVEPMKEE